LTSLQEVTVFTGASHRDKQKIPVEPTVIAVGQYHVACALNNKAYFYAIEEEKGITPLSDSGKTYLGSVSALKVLACICACRSLPLSMAITSFSAFACCMTYDSHLLYSKKAWHPHHQFLSWREGRG